MQAWNTLTAKIKIIFVKIAANSKKNNTSCTTSALVLKYIQLTTKN